MNGQDVFPGMRLSCFARAPARRVRRYARTGEEQAAERLRARRRGLRLAESRCDNLNQLAPSRSLPIPSSNSNMEIELWIPPRLSDRPASCRH